MESEQPNWGLAKSLWLSLTGLLVVRRLLARCRRRRMLRGRTTLEFQDWCIDMAGDGGSDTPAAALVWRALSDCLGISVGKLRSTDRFGEVAASTVGWMDIYEAFWEVRVELVRLKGLSLAEVEAAMGKNRPETVAELVRFACRYSADPAL